MIILAVAPYPDALKMAIGHLSRPAVRLAVDMADFRPVHLPADGAGLTLLQGNACRGDAHRFGYGRLTVLPAQHHMAAA